jgi:hypothetical protein
MEEAFEEGQGPHRAVEPVVMMMNMAFVQTFEPHHRIKMLCTTQNSVRSGHVTWVWLRVSDVPGLENVRERMPPVTLIIGRLCVQSSYCAAFSTCQWKLIAG